jgi:hypothetical protein
MKTIVMIRAIRVVFMTIKTITCIICLDLSVKIYPAGSHLGVLEVSEYYHHVQKPNTGNRLEHVSPKHESGYWGEFLNSS